MYRNTRRCEMKSQTETKKTRGRPARLSKSGHHRRRSRSTGWSCCVNILKVVDGIGQGVQVQAKSLVSPSRKNGGSLQDLSAQAARRLLPKTDPSETATIMGSLGHPHRLIILQRLLRGAASYRDLHEAAKLKAGPLYHHVSTLRLAGLICAKKRDIYELTELGQYLALVSAIIPKLVRARSKRVKFP